MDKVKIGKVYRHFKGNYYFVENIAYDSETQERMVVYKPLYHRADEKNIWIRPEKMFLEENGVSIENDNKKQYNGNIYLNYLGYNTYRKVGMI